MSIVLILLIAALIFFLLDAFSVPTRVSWTPLGLACGTLAFILQIT